MSSPQDDPVLVAQDSEQAPPEPFSPQLILTITNDHYRSPPSEVTTETKEDENTEQDKNESSVGDPKTVSHDIIGHALSLAQASTPVTHVPVLKTLPQPVKGEEPMGGDMMIKMAQSRLALLQRHAVSPSVLKPANLVCCCYQLLSAIILFISYCRHHWSV